MRLTPVLALLLPVLGWSQGVVHPAPFPSLSRDGTVPGRRLDTAPTIDGIVDLEREWAGVPGGEGAFDDQTGEPAPEGMRFWLAYDAKYIYFAIQLDDSQPDSIRAVEYRTNASLGGDDHIEFQIDPFGNFSDRHRFRINPRGATDLSIPGGTANKREWQGEFQAAGRITETGWEAEARIPWAVLRLPGAGKRTLRVNVSRELQRLNREFEWRDTTRGQYQNAGYWTDVEIPDVDHGRRILALPYGYAGLDEHGGTLDGGIDLKGKLTDQIEGVMTLNPDFRNVENQILSLDFSYFERLAGESRPFFLEGQGYFGDNEGPRIFASQRIRQIDFGAKAFGKMGETTSLGVLGTRDAHGGNTVVGNVSQKLGDQSSLSGAFVADQRDGTTSQAGSFGIYTRSGLFSLYGSHTMTSDPDRGKGYRHNAGFYYGDALWEAGVSYTEVSPDLYPRVGYAPETDYKGPSVFVQYSRPYDSGPLEEVQVGSSYRDQTTIAGDPYRRQISLSVELTFRAGVAIDLGAFHQTFRGYDDHSYSVDVGWPRGNPYNHWGIELGWGRVGGVDYQSLGPSFSYRANDRLQIRGSYEYFERDGVETQSVLSANYDFDAYRAVAARFVQRDADVSFYLAFRQSGNAGNEYYLIIGDPNSDSFRPSVIFKAVLPIEFRF
ncbi:MAG: hypothetical protein M9921_02140 [Fimbriimonadaceae bacterium]|nr:hypothetical protein [Fimbriimonadaceae bacterium]